MCIAGTCDAHAAASLPNAPRKSEAFCCARLIWMLISSTGTLSLLLLFGRAYKTASS